MVKLKIVGMDFDWLIDIAASNYTVYLDILWYPTCSTMFLYQT